MKTCNKCNIEKPIADFGVRRDLKDGLNTICKECNRLKSKRFRRDNPEHARELDRKSKLKNRDKKVIYQRAYYQKNKDRLDVKNREWDRNNPHCKTARCSKRRALKKQAITPTTCLSTIKDIYNNCPEGYHVDHIVPLAKKGKHHQDNLCYLPASLNVAKGAKILEDYPELLKQFNEQVIYPNIKA